MRFRPFFNLLTKAASAAALLIVLAAATVVNVDAQATSRITIVKDFCASIGAQNTCNGIPNNFPNNVLFQVDLGTYDVNTGIFTVSTGSPDVTVAIQQNANGMTTTGDIFTSGTYIRVCESVPLTWMSIPRPENSTGGSTQYASNNCLIVLLGPGNNSLKFINGPGGTTAGEAAINGQVRDSRGVGLARIQLVLVNAATGETKTALTNPFGYYAFDELDLNELYVLRVQHKRYKFAEKQRTISITDSIAEVDFVALP
jgi:hypothetical protein